MIKLLFLKERLQNIYQRCDFIIMPVLKLVIAVIVFTSINNAAGYHSTLNSLTVVILLSLLCVFTPVSVMLLLAAFLLIGHVYAASIFLAVIVAAVLFVLYFLFIRFTPKLGYAVLAIPLLFYFKIPYVVPLFLGVSATPVAIIPAGCGVVVYYLILKIQEAAVIITGNDMEEVLQLYRYVMDSMLADTQMFIIIGIFALVIIITYVIRRLSFDYAFDIAIVSGMVANIILFLLVDLRMDVSNQIFSMILGTIISAIIVYIIQFFRLCLDYTAVERVQFEDDNYYYYVKAVPKARLSSPERNVKRINPRRISGVRSRNYRGQREDTEVKGDHDSEEQN